MRHPDTKPAAPPADETWPDSGGNRAGRSNPEQNAPAPEWICRRIDELTRRYAREREALATIRKMRRLEWTVNVPKRLEQVTGLTGFVYRDASIADEQATLPTLYTSQLPSLSLTADAGRRNADELTTRLEEFTVNALFKDCGSRAEGPPTHERLFDGVFEGAAWTKLVCNPQGIWSDYLDLAKRGEDAYDDDAPDLERDDDETDDQYTRRKRDYKPRSKRRKYLDATERAKKRAGVPVEWRFVDAMNVLPIYEGDVLRAVIEVQKRSLSQTFEDYGLGFDADGQICPAATAVADWEQRHDADATVDLIMYHDATWQSYLLRYQGGWQNAGSGSYAGSAERIPGYTRRHRMRIGRPPYFVSLGSTHNYEYARVATAAATETKRPLVEYLSFLRTIMAYLAVRDAIPPIAEETPLDGSVPLDGETNAPAGPEVYEAGMKYRLMPGQVLRPLTLPDNTQALQAEIAATMGDIERRGPTRITGSLEGAGAAMATAFERDRAKFNQHEASIVKHLREVTLALWRILEDLDEPVYVASSGKKTFVKADPEDFAAALDPVWTLHVDSMSSDVVKEQYLDRRVKNGTLGINQAIERQGDNVDEVMKARAEDQARQSETFAKAQEAEILAHWGRGDWANQQRRAEQMAQMPQQGQMQGAPGQPQVAVPPGANGITSAGASVAPPMGGGQGGVPPGMPAAPTVPMQAAVAGVHGGAPGG